MPPCPDAIRIVYANGLPVSIPEELPEGLAVMDLEDFVLQYPDAAGNTWKQRRKRSVPKNWPP